MTAVEIEDRIRIDAPPEDVWKAIQQPSAHARWHPFVTRIDGEHRLGAIRTCSVIVGRREGTTTELCIEDVPGHALGWRIEEDSTGFSRMVSDWRAGFRLEPQERGTLVTARSTFAPRNPLVRLITPLVRRKFHRTQQAILDGLKRSVEV